MITEADHRRLFHDHLPYAMPERLSDLRGPSGGVITLPVTICWAPNRTFDLADVEARRWAYTYVIMEGSRAQQEKLLNEDLLRRTWPTLTLPQRCRELWQSRFGLAATIMRTA